jgi:hypothetical protein
MSLEGRTPEGGEVAGTVKPSCRRYVKLLPCRGVVQ